MKDQQYEQNTFSGKMWKKELHLIESAWDPELQN